MKNLLIYISPTGSFDNPRPDLKSNDAGPLVKVQIENSLALGWKEEDILLYTNFDFKYGVVKANVLKDVEFFELIPQASKINAIIKLFEKGLINDNELYWFHDLDAFQLYPITESELELGKADMALTDYGFSRRWNTGSIFFKKSSKDIFYRIKEVMYSESVDEETALCMLTVDSISIRERVKRINNTYNFVPYGFNTGYKMAIKPIKVVHFHPLLGIPHTKIKSSVEFFKGENDLHIPLITERLVKILRYHRIR